ncbi:hypothetical protein M8J77_021011 [Diaphorina citri]|nr:hypothetical protein M8J77_021011 [Diaphorina citri]
MEEREEAVKKEFGLEEENGKKGDDSKEKEELEKKEKREMKWEKVEQEGEEGKKRGGNEMKTVMLNKCRNKSNCVTNVGRKLASIIRKN